jgi:hypothetical protein
MSSPTKCVLCGKPATRAPVFGDHHREFSCQVCGNYSITGSAVAIVGLKPIQNPGAVSGWIRQQNVMGSTPHIGDDVDHLRVLKKPSFRERAERYLVAIADQVSRVDKPAKVMSWELVGITYSDDAAELSIFLKYWGEEGLLKRVDGKTEQHSLTAKGYITADDLRGKRAASAQAFVAMWYSEDMKRVYREGFEPGIRDAGFQPMLLLDAEHAEKIDDKIIAEIRRSAFLVADFTGHRQNVYLETGFALGLGLPVIWTCHKRDAGKLHFDIRQYNYIDWENEAELAQRLQRRIGAMFGQGPLSP